MQQVIEALKAGQPVLLATDTVYGVAAIAGSKGCEEIYRLKQRPAGQALPWLVLGADCLGVWANNVPDYARELARAFWPGAMTLIVNASPAALDRGVHKNGTVALRVPDDETCLRLLNALDAPLCCTSANVHGKPAPTRLEDVDKRFLSLAHSANLARRCPGRQASTIVDCTGSRLQIVRDGALTEQIKQHLSLHYC